MDMPRRPVDASPATLGLPPVDISSQPSDVTLLPQVAIGDLGQGDFQGRPDADRTDITPPEGRRPAAETAAPGHDRHLPATAMAGEVARPAEQDDASAATIPIDTPPPASEGQDPPNDTPGEAEVAERSEPPFTIVEIGSGEDPILSSPNAPDVSRLYSQGGRYIGLDASRDRLEGGAEISPLYLQVHTTEEAPVDVNFVEADIRPGNPLPENVEQDSADRVIISNVLTDPRVARQPDVCEAIAQAAKDLIRKDGEGEVVVIGTLSPVVYPSERVTELMASVGLEHKASDVLSNYYPNDDEDWTPNYAYAERYGLPDPAESTDEAPETVEAADTAESSYTVVEIGSGRNPVLHYETAPDIARLYDQGGRYIGVDANPHHLAAGARGARTALAVNAQEGAEVSATFTEGTVIPGAPLPEALQPDSADRVVISNVLTNEPIARDSELCTAIADAALQVVRKDPPGEVVVVGTLTSDEYPAAAAIDLFTRHGFEHIGSDNVGDYLPPGWEQGAEEAAYVERFRARQQQEPRQ